MLGLAAGAMKRLTTLCGFLAVVSAGCIAQKTVHCPDGDHIQIDVTQIAIKYDASSIAGTLSSLSVLSARLQVVPKQLQEAAVATQQWNEFVKGLVVGYNSCAVTRQQYADGLNRIYPRLKQDGVELEAIRKAMAAGQKADEKRLETLLASYMGSLRQFAQAGGQEIILQRIENLSNQMAAGQTKILEGQAKEGEVQEQILKREDSIDARLRAIEERDAQAPLAKPSEVGKQISEVRKQLLAKADVAEQAYNKGYELMDQYRFGDAIPYLQQALDAVPLPDFYLALGRAYWEEVDLPRAESTLQQGLLAIADENDERHEAQLANLLGLVLYARGDLDDALRYTQRALMIDEKVYGPDHPEVAAPANNIGQILKDKGDLDGALSHARRALTIDEKTYGPDSPEVAIDVSNIGQILKDKGDLDGALMYTQRALTIDEKVYGPGHPHVAIDANNMGQILQYKGDLDGAFKYMQRALTIDEKAYGPDHPTVARGANNIGAILIDMGDLDGALRYMQRALTIDEKVYGPDYPTVAKSANNIGAILAKKGDLDDALRYTQRALTSGEKVYGPDNPDVAMYANNIGQILKDKGDLDGAFKYTQRALMIDEKVYGPDHPTVAVRCNNIGQILRGKRDLEGALTYTQRALTIDEKVYGPDHPTVATRCNNIGQILKDKGDLDGAFKYTQRALMIDEKVYGPDNPATKVVAANLKAIEQAKAQQH